MDASRDILRLALAATLSIAAAPAAATEIGASAATAGLAIHDAQETLRDFCATDAEGRLWLQLPGGSRFELVTSTSDPAITNPGDGSFHPFDADEVRAAIAAVRFPLQGIQAHVYLLPYPRRHGLDSAAGPGLILLSPGVRPLTRQHQHSEAIHELGHVVQYTLLPDTDQAGWNRYRALRGIEDRTVYSAGSRHADRPHEIFAEDFRALFGGEAATASGTIENAALRHPTQVPGLAAFMLALGGGVPVQASPLSATPNPSRGGVRFVHPDPDAGRLELFDVLGRRVARLEARAGGGGTEWWWDGRDAGGAPLGTGILLARLSGRRAETLRVTVLR